MPSVPDANAINRGQRGAAGGLLPPCPGLGLPPLSCCRLEAPPPELRGAYHGTDQVCAGGPGNLSVFGGQNQSEVPAVLPFLDHP